MLKVKYLRIVLFLVALHSTAVGINLIVLPPEWMHAFGFENISNNFFKVQGGVFHLVMAVAYSLAAWKPGEYDILIRFSIVAKAFATVFLISYYIMYEHTLMILFSGIVDFFMGLTLFILYRKTDL